MTSFRKFHVGGKLNPTAAQANAWNEAAVAHKQDRNRKTSSLEAKMRSANRAPVSNDSGSDLQAFSVLQLTSSAIDPSVNENEYLNRPAFTGGSVANSNTSLFCITQQQLKDGDIDSNAVMSGVTYARLTGKAGQTVASPIAGQSTLEAGAGGACSILYDPGPATEERTAIVRIGSGPVVKRGVISELGDYDVHKVTLTSGSFTEDLTTDGLEITYADVTAYAASELDYHLNPGDVVKLALIDGQYWIIDAEPDCNGYCIDENFTNSYVYGWSFRAPNLPCCPEAGGVHILTTSDSGATYESATFECNSDGTTRKWLFNDRKLRLTPRLDEGNIEYWTDNAPTSCTVQLQHYEPQRFPTRDALCGKLPASVCLNPLCGVGSCDACNGLTIMEWEIDFGGGGESNPYYLPSVYDYCDSPSGVVRAYQNFDSNSTGYCLWSSYTGTMIATVSISTASPPVMTVSGYEYGTGSQGVFWTAEGPFDCDGEITLNVDYNDDINPTNCTNYPSTITVRPVRGAHLEDNCYPTTGGTLGNDICELIPYVVEIDLTGIADGTCNQCSLLNDLHRLTLDNNNVARWIGDTIAGNCLSSYTTTPGFTITVSGSTIYLGLGQTSGFFNRSATYTMTRDDFNCYGNNVFTYSSDDGECTSWPATITVYPMVSTI